MNSMQKSGTLGLRSRSVTVVNLITVFSDEEKMRKLTYLSRQVEKIFYNQYNQITNNPTNLLP